IALLRDKKNENGEKERQKSGRKLKRRVALFSESDEEDDRFNALDSNNDDPFCLPLKRNRNISKLKR
ncbi:hypothetical protein ILUMI_26915, partial [Ignelater luminosus]